MEGNIDILVKELCKLPKETGWVEFKHNDRNRVKALDPTTAKRYMRYVPIWAAI